MKIFSLKNHFRASSIAALTMVFVLLGATSANAALTVGALALTSDGVLTLNGAAASNSVLFGANTTGTIAVGGALTTGTLTLGVATQTGNVTIHGATTGGANALFNSTTTSTISIGGATTTGSITIGNASATTAGVFINAGSDGIELTGQLVTKGAAPAATQSAGTATITATSTDTAGVVTSDATAHTTVTLTFATAYTTAPSCTFSPANAVAAALVGSANGVIGATTTTTMVLTHDSSAAVGVWHYNCFELE